MNSLTSAKTTGICLGLVIIAIILITVFKVPLGTLLFTGALLACPLSHVLMMKDKNHKH